MSQYVCKTEIFDVAAELKNSAAEFFVKVCALSVAARGRFAVALAGGSTPKALYEMLAGESYRDRVDWTKTLVFFGDERCVAPDDEQSNFKTANDAVLAKVDVPSANIFRMKGEIAPAEAAAAYEKNLRETLGDEPRFDLILLGMGDDGHTASLFPESEALHENERSAVENYIEKFDSYRLTLTFRTINRARNILFLVTGEKKAEAFAEVSKGKNPQFPASLVAPEDGECFWFVDCDAAKIVAASS